jgi:DNA replication protein DnaC
LTSSEIEDRNQRRELFEAFIADRGEMYRDCRTENYEIYDDAQRGVVETLQAYADDLDENVTDGRGIMLFGTSGTGKDHLLAAMARVATNAHGLRVVWSSGQQLFGRIRDTIGTDATEEALIGQYTRPTILLLSDPAPMFGDVTPHQANMLYRIIDERTNRYRPTWITINVKDREEANKKIGGPVVERLAHNAVTARCQWPSYRMRKGER